MNTTLRDKKSQDALRKQVVFCFQQVNGKSTESP